MSKASNLLHRLWTKAASAHKYDKSEWMELESAVTAQDEELKKLLAIAEAAITYADWPHPAHCKCDCPMLRPEADMLAAVDAARREPK